MTNPVALTLADEPENVSITGCYIRNRNESKSIRLMIQFRFAAAFAVSYNLDRSPADGILGLGLSKYVAAVAAWIVWCAHAKNVAVASNMDSKIYLYRLRLR